MNNWLENYRKKLEERDRITDLCEEDLEFRADCFVKCQRDYKFFIEDFCWIYEPRPEYAAGYKPFLLYPFQKKYLDWLQERFEENADGLTEKTRDMGITWLYVAWLIWHWRFDDTFNALLGSRKEDLVDKIGDPDSLFWKLETLVNYLPSWLRPAEYDRNKHRKTLLLTNPETGNTISGESANPDFSRQGRYSVIVLDEFAFWPYGWSVWTATGDSAPCRIAVSTVRGMNNKFAELRHHSNIGVFIADWRDHPLKTQEWHDKEAARRTAKEMAQEINRDYEASGGALWLPWYPKHQDQIEQEFKISAEWYIYASIDQHPRNPSSVHIYGLDYDGFHFSIDELYETEQTIDIIADWLLKHNLWQRIRIVYADPQLWAKDQEVKSGMQKVAVFKSRAELLAERGIIAVPGIKGKDIDARERTGQIIEQGRLKIHPRCKYQRWEFREALRWDDYTELIGQRKGFKEELADKNNHAWDDWKYFIMSNPVRPMRTPKPKVIAPKPLTPGGIVAGFKDKKVMRVGQYAIKEK